VLILVTAQAAEDVVVALKKPLPGCGDFAERE
jgi:hypothetical protein